MCVHILFKLNSVFLLVFAVFLTLTRNRMIVYFEAKQPTRVADKNIFSSDFPSCWITGTEKQSVFWRTNQNSSQIIPWVSFIVHYEFSAQHTVWMQCEIHVKYSGIQSFHVEVKKACMQYDTKVCSSPCVVLFERLTCTLLPDNQYWQVTHVGREAIQKTLNVLRQIEYVSFVSALTPVFTVNRHYRERSCNQQFLDFTEAL